MNAEGIKYIEKTEEKKDKFLWYKIIYKIAKENPILPVLFFFGVGFILLGIILW